MSNYSKTVDFAAKDALVTGNANKIVKGTEIDDEFDAIATAVATKANLISPTLTGTPLAPTAAADTNTTQIATTAFVEAAKTAVENAYAAADAAHDLIQMIAGNGITGGGTLAADRTLTLGTPGTTSDTSTNAVTATSHTHALSIDGEFTGTGVQDIVGTTGYQVLPGGFIIQWGGEQTLASQATATVTFPLAFPTRCVNVAISDTNRTDSLLTVSLQALPSATSFIASNAGGGYTKKFFWMAIGF